MPKFERHFNRAMGKEYHTSKDYVRDMKKMGLEPYNPKAVKTRERRDYTPSKECREVTAAAVKQLKETGKVSGAVRDWVAKTGSMKATPERLKNETKGGIYHG